MMTDNSADHSPIPLVQGLSIPYGQDSVASAQACLGPVSALRQSSFQAQWLKPWTSASNAESMWRGRCFEKAPSYCSQDAGRVETFLPAPVC